jgi:hypothetical protein
MKNNYMMLFLFFMIILHISSVFGMDSFSDDPDLTEYTKQEPTLDDSNDYYMLEKYLCKENFDVKKLPKENGEHFYEYNELKLKRKHQPDKFCEFCARKSSNGRLINSKITHYGLCEACYMYERRHQKLIPLNERENYKNNFTCEFCQKETPIHKRGINGGKSLCHPCYDYERRYGNLIPLTERKHHEKHKDRILVCEFCQKESNIYKKGKVSGKSLCNACYIYESRHGYLMPLHERKKRKKHNDCILVCEFCQQESVRYKKSQVCGKVLCQPCYNYERRYGHAKLVDKRKKYHRKNNENWK